jgi:hypothetical protein
VCIGCYISEPCIFLIALLNVGCTMCLVLSRQRRPLDSTPHRPFALQDQASTWRAVLRSSTLPNPLRRSQVRISRTAVWSCGKRASTACAVQPPTVQAPVQLQAPGSISSSHPRSRDLSSLYLSAAYYRGHPAPPRRIHLWGRGSCSLPLLRLCIP